MTNSKLRPPEGCSMISQGFSQGACLLSSKGKLIPACHIALRFDGKLWYRLIYDIQLSRPEDYLSIYMSLCNHKCLKCHSWYFTQHPRGEWRSTEELAEEAAIYEKFVTVEEPRYRATMWHATDLCRHCGLCVLRGIRGPLCPRKLSPEQVIWSPQGYGPARNIVAFTGGDLACRVEFYAQLTEKIKERTKLWVLFETNGYGLTPKNLDILKDAGVDSFWLDIKAYDDNVYRRLCGTTNQWILKTPEWIMERDFVLEVLVLYIPGLVEIDQIVSIAKIIADIDEKIPFTILAFFPEYKLANIRSPTLGEMITAFFEVKRAGLKNVKLGNCHIFAHTTEDWRILVGAVGPEGIG